MQYIQVDKNICTHCMLCQSVCPSNAIYNDNDTVAIDNEKCTLCKLCIEKCNKQNAIAITAQKKQNDISDFEGIAVWIEHQNGSIAPVSLEVIGVAYNLKKTMDTTLSAIVIGQDIKHFYDDLISYGVDEIWSVESDQIQDYYEDVQTEVIIEIIKEKKPEIFLGGGTVLGRSIMPRVAATLKTGLTADCTELHYNKELKLLEQTRPAFGGKIMATIHNTSHRPQMATIRNNVMPKPEKIENSKGVIISFDHIDIPDPHIEVLNYIEEREYATNLNDANIILSIGRGIKDPKNIKIIEKFAKRINGSIGASRAVVDAGWIPYFHQIGQTGKTVNPTIYFAIGISGAIQHVSGMKNSDLVIAINKDENAPIFEVADIGLVGDLFEIMNEMNKYVSNDE